MIKGILRLLPLLFLLLSFCRMNDDKSTTPVVSPSEGDGYTTQLSLLTEKHTTFSGDSVSLIVELFHVKDSALQDSSPVPDAAITLTVSEGASLSETKLKTSTTGQALAMFFAEIPDTLSTSKKYTVIATYADISDTVHIQVTNQPEDIQGQMGIVADPSIKAYVDDKIGSMIIVTLTDTNGVFLSGAEVAFRTTVGGILVTQSQTNERGQATATLYSVPKNITALVTAVLISDTSVTASVPVSFTGVKLLEPNTHGKSSISPNGKDTLEVTVTLYDAGDVPVYNEAIRFRPLDSTLLVHIPDSATNNKGEATCFITGVGKGVDSLEISAAGIRDTIVVSYSGRFMVLDTAGFGNTYVVRQNDAVPLPKMSKSKIRLLYKESGGESPVSDAKLLVAVSGGDIILTDASGKESFTGNNGFVTDRNGAIEFFLRNPASSGEITIAVSATEGEQHISSMFTMHFNAGPLTRLDLEGTPEVLTIGGDEAMITATAYDAQGNLRVGETISFQMTNNPGGTERLEPSVVVTNESGQAVVKFITGETESSQQGINITAKSYPIVNEQGIVEQGIDAVDTIKLTIANHVKKITLSSNIREIEEDANGTYALKLSVLVSDINGNPVPDGTPVTFSARIIGYALWKRGFSMSNMGNVSVYSESVVGFALPFEDYNYNYIRDWDENYDAIPTYPLYRGEDIAWFAGDKAFRPGPWFKDINANGVRDYYSTNTQKFNPVNYEMVEPWFKKENVADTVKGLSTIQIWSGDPVLIKPNGDTLVDGDEYYFMDYNGNGVFDISEPTRIDDAAYENQSLGFNDSIGRYEDIDWNWNGRPDPSSQTAFIIEKTVLTQGGQAINKLYYGQDDGNRLCVEIWAESKGLSATPERIYPLPITEGASTYFNPFKGKSNL